MLTAKQESASVEGFEYENYIIRRSHNSLNSKIILMKSSSFYAGDPCDFLGGGATSIRDSVCPVSGVSKKNWFRD